MPPSIHHVLLSLTLGTLCHQPCAADYPLPNTIQVITSNQRPVTSQSAVSTGSESPKPHITTLNLDAVTEIEQELNQHLPVDPEQARAMAERRIAEFGQQRLEKRLRKAYQALVVAMEHNLDRYPAVIFDEQAVVYGVTDLAVATRHYRRWLEKQPEAAENE